MLDANKGRGKDIYRNLVGRRIYVFDLFHCLSGNLNGILIVFSDFFFLFREGGSSRSSEFLQTVNGSRCSC